MNGRDNPSRLASNPFPRCGSGLIGWAPDICNKTVFFVHKPGHPTMSFQKDTLIGVELPGSGLTDHLKSLGATVVPVSFSSTCWIKWLSHSLAIPPQTALSLSAEEHHLPITENRPTHEIQKPP